MLGRDCSVLKKVEKEDEERGRKDEEQKKKTHNNIQPWEILKLNHRIPEDIWDMEIPAVRQTGRPGTPNHITVPSSKIALPPLFLST